MRALLTSPDINVHAAVVAAQNIARDIRRASHSASLLVRLTKERFICSEDAPDSGTETVCEALPRGIHCTGVTK